MHPNAPIPSRTSPDFDKLAFRKYVKNIGKPYRKRAVELVSICRAFVQAQDRTPNSYYELGSALQLVDDALMSATEAGKKTSKEADEAFKNAVSELVVYEGKYHLEENDAERVEKADAERVKKNVAERIKVAEEADKSSLKTLNSLMEKFRRPKEEPTTEVEFLLHKSLPDKNPITVKQELCQSSHLNEILWNFGRFKNKEKRLTLKQNPHFYKVLPKAPEKYDDKFRTEPIETYLHKRISVLTDNFGHAGRVFLKTAKRTRVFGKVWVPKKAIIFKDVCGKLEGESIVGAAIHATPNLWCFAEPPPSSHTSRSSSPSSVRSSPSPTTIATPTTSSTGLLLTDWREPIRQMLSSPDVNIRISINPPINSVPSSPAPSSPSPQSGLGSSLGSLPPTDTPQTRSPIPKPPPAELSPSSPPHPSPEPSSKLSSQPIAVPALSTRAPLPMPLPPQPRSVASPSTSSATPASMTHPPPDTHSRRVSRKDGSFSGDTIPLQPSIAEVPSLNPSKAITRSLQGISTVTPHASSNEAELTRHVPTQRPGPAPGPSFQHEVARVVNSDPPPQPRHVQTVVPKLEVPEPQKRRKNWFQRHVWDYAQ